MKVLYYNELNYQPLKKQFEKLISYLEKGDFKSADVKKLKDLGYYRAKLDKENRLIFKIGEYEGEKYLFLLEIILNHAYDKSRFLSGASIDENKLGPLGSEKQLKSEDLEPVRFVNKKQQHFHILDKILSFDEEQETIFNSPPPVIIIGSAGSGKTALTLEKIKQLRGRILYVTLSSYLVENSSELYYSFGYDNDKQEIDFLSFAEYLGAIELPMGKEIDFQAFSKWIWRYQQAYKIKDSYKLFEEFKGVLTGTEVEKPYLSEKDYMDLGIRQSVYSKKEREVVYELFTKYLEFLKEGEYYDSNIAAFQRIDQVNPLYDFVVVDEVQDITNIQLSLILRSLKQAQNFILCGDSNQIVHPNFFSWANVKTLFYQQDLKGQLTRILYSNYRNTPEVTHIANQLLRVKNARFGSIDKESTFLVKANSSNHGEVEFFQDTPKVKKELDRRTGKSARFAVLVMRNEDKPGARKFFSTPLIFSVQEAKGLEYENIILYNFITDNESAFREICQGVKKSELEGDLKYARAKSKSDKSLDEYKFYINSLYVAITRAVKNLYVIEKVRKHELLNLLDLVEFKDQVKVEDQRSSDEEWQKEARRLELQGKKEQAENIRKQILHTEEVPWEVITSTKLEILKSKALDPENYNKKAKDILFEYALIYNEIDVFPQLVELKYRKAENWAQKGFQRIELKYEPFFADKVTQVSVQLRKYGPDFRNPFNFTPLMMAAMGGSPQLIDHLLEIGADPQLKDNLGRQAFQIALWKSYLDHNYIRTALVKVYKRLQPDAIKVKFRNRLIKLNSNQMEFFMLNFMIALLKEITTFKIQVDLPGFESVDFVETLTHFPERIMPEYRKRRQYISSILAKNEIFRDDPYNRQLFFRIRRGYYIINPLLEVEFEGKWHNIYDLMQTMKMENSEDEYIQEFGKYLRGVRKKLNE